MVTMILMIVFSFRSINAVGVLHCVEHRISFIEVNKHSHSQVQLIRYIFLSFAVAVFFFNNILNRYLLFHIIGFFSLCARGAAIVYGASLAIYLVLLSFHRLNR